LLVRANFEFKDPSDQLLDAAASHGDMHLPEFLSSAEKHKVENKIKATYINAK
jgi:hypothetical protein